MPFPFPKTFDIGGVAIAPFPPDLYVVMVGAVKILGRWSCTVCIGGWVKGLQLW